MFLYDYLCFKWICFKLIQFCILFPSLPRPMTLKVSAIGMFFLCSYPPNDASDHIFSLRPYRPYGHYRRLCQSVRHFYSWYSSPAGGSCRHYTQVFLLMFLVLTLIVSYDHRVTQSNIFFCIYMSAHPPEFDSFLTFWLVLLSCLHLSICLTVPTNLFLLLLDKKLVKRCWKRLFLSLCSRTRIDH